MDTIISFYKFVPLENLELLKTYLKTLCVNLGLKGTILIAKEGINGGLSGSPEAIQTFKATMEADSRFTNFPYKDSLFEHVSFKRMLVKIKKEIITMGKPNINPTQDTGAYVKPLELKKWLDEGREVVMVDTRNDYEVNAGTFKTALDPKIKVFSEFPDWVETHLADAKDKLVVTYCTGGIRCEKATAYMKQVGFTNVYQIDGGILRYFEETNAAGGEDHWVGDCVVFDKRKALTKALEPTTQTICYVCLNPVAPEKVAKTQYEAGPACVACDSLMQERHAERINRGLARHKANLERRAAHKRMMHEKHAAPTAPLTSN